MNTQQRAQAVWERLAAACAEPALPVTPPPGFTDRVLAAVPQARVALVRNDQQRVVSAAAWLALAASVLICVWSWNDLQAAWNDSETEVFEELITWDPLP
jgi:hypothetical protein